MFPLVASGHLDSMTWIHVGCCIGEGGLLVSPGVHQGNVLVLQFIFHPAQVFPRDTPSDGVLIDLAVQPDSLGRMNEYVFNSE